MKTIFVIQDVESKENYWQFSGSSGFSLETDSIVFFKNKKEALNELKKEDLLDLFNSRIIEIREFYIFGNDEE